MTSINQFAFSAKAMDSPFKAGAQSRPVDMGTIKAAGPEVAISDLASRLSKASQVSSDRNAGLDRQALAVKVQANIDHILYPLDPPHMAAAAHDMPQPGTADSISSANSATAYINDNALPNPFAGLSRDQLAAISNDESGTFTLNERRAAFMQAYNEEQAWRAQIVQAAQQELDDKGTLTGFFAAAREHFMALPLTEQVLYPATYATDLASKADRGFHDLGADPWSLLNAPRQPG